MPHQKNNYHLHYRGEFSLLEMDFMLHNTPYLTTEYIFLHTAKPRCLSGYLTKKGLGQMKNLGAKKMLNNKWKSEFNEAVKTFRLIDQLKGTRIPSIGTNRFKQFLRNIKKYTKIITTSYIYCEQPTLVALEERANEKTIYNRLEWIGRHKLAAHRRLSVLKNLFGRIISQYSKTHHLPLSDVAMMRYDEFDKTISGYKQIPSETLKKRKRGFVWLQEQGKWAIKTS